MTTRLVFLTTRNRHNVRRLRAMIFRLLALNGN